MNTLNVQMSKALIVVLALILSISTFAFSQNAGVANSETRQVSEFNEIDLSSGHFTVYLSQTDKESLRIEGSKELLSLIKSEVKNNELHIYMDQPDKTKEKAVVYIGFRDLKEMNCSGAISVSTQGMIKTNETEFEFSGASKANLEFTTSLLEISVSGSSSIKIKGSADMVELNISGAGNYDAADLNSKNYDIDISGAGTAIIAVSDKMDVSISGSGTVKYKGDPSIEKSISGAGKITKL
jgi:hypothetical protein